jgi:hypothetical protein
MTKYLRKSSKKERLISAHCFRGISPWLVGSDAFGPVVRQVIVVGA